MNSENNSPKHPLPSILRQISLWLISAAGCFLFVLLSLKSTSTVKAQTPTPPNTPTPTCTVTPTPSVTASPTPTPCAKCSPHMTPNASPSATPIPSPYQLPEDQGVLEWRPFVPTGNPPWPAIVLIHPGGFYEGSMYGMVLSIVAQDLADAGYITFVVSYRLAPCGQIEGQPCHNDDAETGRPPQQTDDIKAAIRAVRADGRCNGKVGAVGGSAGASHAVFVVLDTTTSANWSPSLRPDCAVGLSGAYDFSDRTDENYPANVGDPLPAFVSNVTNYTNTTDLTIQKDLSPVSLVTTPTGQKPFKPIMILTSRYDPMPYHQIVDLQCAFQEKDIDPSLYQFITVPDASDHAFALWDNYDAGYPYAQLIKSRVINFLDAHLK